MDHNCSGPLEIQFHSVMGINESHPAIEPQRAGPLMVRGQLHHMGSPPFGPLDDVLKDLSAYAMAPHFAFDPYSLDLGAHPSSVR